MNRLNQGRIQGVGYVRPSTISGNVGFVVEQFCYRHNRNDLKGEGLVQDVKDKIVGVKDKLIKKFLQDRPKVMNDLLNKEGEQKIVKMEACRNPIKALWEKLLNVATFGGLKRAMAAKGYDSLFHLYLVVHLANGKIYSLEKNERVNIIDGKKLKPNGTCSKPIIVNESLTLNQLILRAEKRVGKNFYRYSMFEFNCQNWVNNILNGSGFNQLDDFVIQDVASLAPSIIKTLTQGITDIAGVVDFFKRGGGKKKVGKL